jgi:histidyl-tRNA synthetase
MPADGALEPRKLGSELKRAVASGAAGAVIIGSQERERAELTIGDLRQERAVHGSRR